MKLWLYGSIYRNGHYLPEIESEYRLTSKVYELNCDILTYVMLWLARNAFALNIYDFKNLFFIFHIIIFYHGKC
jgi:hypothetical protein